MTCVPLEWLNCFYTLLIALEIRTSFPPETLKLPISWVLRCPWKFSETYGSSSLPCVVVVPQSIFVSNDLICPRNTYSTKISVHYTYVDMWLMNHFLARLFYFSINGICTSQTTPRLFFLILPPLWLFETFSSNVIAWKIMLTLLHLEKLFIGTCLAINSVEMSLRYLQLISSSPWRVGIFSLDYFTI